MNWAQYAIIVLGLSTAWLYNSANVRVRKWAPVLSLCSQPVWGYAAYVAEQWGAFMMSFAYGALAVRGIYQFWRTKT